MSDLVHCETEYCEVLKEIKATVDSISDSGTRITQATLKSIEKVAALSETLQSLAEQNLKIVRAQAYVRGFLARKRYRLKKKDKDKRKDHRKKHKDTQEKHKDTQEKRKDTQEKRKDTQEKRKDTQEKRKDTQEKRKDTKEKHKDTQGTKKPLTGLASVIHEMIIKEKEFLSTVNNLLENLVAETHKAIKNNSVDLKGLPIPPVFPLLEDLSVFSESLKKDLHASLRSDNVDESVISVIEKKIAKLSLFSEYSKQLPTSMQLLMKMLSNNLEYSTLVNSLVASGVFKFANDSLMNSLIVPARHISDILSFFQDVLNFTGKHDDEKFSELFGVVRRLNDFVTMQINRCDERNEVFEWETKYGLPMLSDGQFRLFIGHGNGVKITLGSKQQSGIFSRSSSKKYPHSYTLFSDCVIFSKNNEVVANIPLKELTVRNPRLHNPSDPHFHLLLTQQNVHDVEFQNAQDCTEFQVKIDKAIEQLERGGIYGKDLRELFVLYNDVPPELRKLAEILASPKNAKTEGIFRLAGGNTEVFALRALLANGTWKTVDIEKFCSIDSIATAFKQFFLELPEPLFTFDLYEPIATMACDDKLPNTEKQAKLKTFLNNAPAANRSMIAFLLNLLSTIAMYAEFNKMPPMNLAIVFVPSLFSPKFENHEQTLNYSKPLFQLLEGMIERLAMVKAAKAGISLKNEGNVQASLERTHSATSLGFRPPSDEPKELIEPPPINANNSPPRTDVEPPPTTNTPPKPNVEPPPTTNTPPKPDVEPPPTTNTPPKPDVEPPPTTNTPSKPNVEPPPTTNTPPQRALATSNQIPLQQLNPSINTHQKSRPMSAQTKAVNPPPVLGNSTSSLSRQLSLSSPQDAVNQELKRSSTLTIPLQSGTSGNSPRNSRMGQQNSSVGQQIPPKGNQNLQMGQNKFSLGNVKGPNTQIDPNTQKEPPNAQSIQKMRVQTAVGGNTFLPPPRITQNPPVIQKTRAASFTEDSTFANIRPPSGDFEVIPPPK